MNTFLWVLQVALGFQFIFAGVMHFLLPDNLPAMMAWMPDLAAESPGVSTFSGVVEILGGLGLILPGLFKIKTNLTPLAAAGLAVVMVGAAVWHIPRAEFVNVGMNIFLGVAMAFVAYQRFKVNPLPEKASAE